MFERFTAKARTVVEDAQTQARQRGADGIRSEHLLAALVTGPESLAHQVLTGFSITPEQILADVDALTDGPSDAEALATLGIDLDEVRRQVEEAFGPGALDRTRAGRRTPWFGRTRFEASAKKVLELALREALRFRHNYIGTEHILLGMIHDENAAAGRILGAHGLRLDVGRVMVEELLRARRAG